MRIDPDQVAETGRKTLPGGFITKLATDGDFVVAAGEDGTIRVLDADDLTLLRTIRLDWGEFSPASLLILGETLFVATHRGQGENGSILVVDDWAPVRGHP